MRLLVLDGSRIMASLVRRLTPDEVIVEEVSNFDDAVASLLENPPDAVIINLGPADLPWCEVKRYCMEHEPPIPILFESCVYRSPAEAGIGELEMPAAFLAKPYHLEDLRRELARLLSCKDAIEPKDHSSEDLVELGTFPRLRSDQ